ncbi:unannotated protein [freshwater metagenome]|uniref:Unannotated protein n=1 Tax=freshwater metagenome TaxID=449393 RepID=A0A6J7HJ63_9ZZZZ|nr:SDR family NAD(P)-dependent oxidoreductase [Actinomycetota bacterium]
MELQGKVVVVTAGASGIGEALVRRVAQERPRGLVVTDLDGAGAVALAAELGGPVRGMQGDASSETDVREALAAAAQFGPVDVFFANAGIAVGTDEQTPDEIWDLAFDVNIRAHVLAARLLVPEWVERGSGCFVSTASAAGLLTQLGCAPYAVTKHAAVAFAEWLAIHYGDRGVQVACVCPQGVNTAMTRIDARGDGLSQLGQDVLRAAGEMLEPSDVAEAVVRGLAEDRFLILPHPEVQGYIERKAADPQRWIGTMQRLRRAIERPGA